jgi:hypothetical protein
MKHGRLVFYMKYMTDALLARQKFAERHTRQHGGDIHTDNTDSELEY